MARAVPSMRLRTWIRYGYFNDRQSFADFWVLEEKFQRSLTIGVAGPTFGETSTIVEIDMSQITRSIRAASDLGASIRERRKTLSMTQGDLAMQAGVSVATISAIENGKDTAQIGIVLDLCRDLGLRLSVET